MNISDLLSHGKQNAVPLRDLVAMTGLPGRTVRTMIERERRAGVPILADNQSGYYLPGEDNDIPRFVRSMRHRANEILRTASAVERGGGPD